MTFLGFPSDVLLSSSLEHDVKNNVVITKKTRKNFFHCYEFNCYNIVALYLL